MYNKEIQSDFGSRNSYVNTSVYVLEIGVIPEENRTFETINASEHEVPFGTKRCFVIQKLLCVSRRSRQPTYSVGRRNSYVLGRIFFYVVYDDGDEEDRKIL